jgi:hypothetical protein
LPLVSVNRRSTQRTSFLLIKSSVRSDILSSSSGYTPQRWPGIK